MGMFLNLAFGSKINRVEKHPIDLSVMPTDATCKQLYLEGFPYIGIREEAQEWLKTLKKEQLEVLVNLKSLQKKTDEVKILKKVLKDHFSKKPNPPANRIIKGSKIKSKSE